ncbi:MAG TPA: RNA polymerase factor sigma-54 [Oligoflexia bacterium]|nr:RNA polymerase factor sigma-54 [Oligoflexia bacterium]HMP49082.1 RNA polymerase factor sigma-54 [Oligoflexia bacterium]
MALEIKLQQKQMQSLVMTPQLQQAIKLLQLGHQDYAEVIASELLENPVLEEVPSDEQNVISSEPISELTDSGDGFEINKTEVALGDLPTSDDTGFGEISFSDSVDEDSGSIRSQNKTDEFEFNGEFYESVRKGALPEDSVSALEGSISVPEGLSSHLLWQLQTSDLTPAHRVIALHIVCNLDHNGFLAATVEEIAEECNVNTDLVEEVLSIVQFLDPVGVASRSLRECLLVQLDSQGRSGSLAWRIVSEHLSDLEVRNYDLIAKKQQVTKEEVFEVVKAIQKLEPRPARSFSSAPTQYISPDVYVKKVGRDYVISLNEAGLPKVRINAEYQEMIQKGKGIVGADKEYIQERVRSAQWLIKSILQRQQTIYKVTESIMRFQREFLEHGISGLKPLVLREIALDVKLHESTISRVTSNKYVHTPHGIFELKFFFSSGLSSGNGDVSSEAVKERIKEIISKENPKKPLSDQELVKLLQSEGLEIARRTVAKYREMSGILSSSRRKKIF